MKSANNLEFPEIDVGEYNVLKQKLEKEGAKLFLTRDVSLTSSDDPFSRAIWIPKQNGVMDLEI